MGKKAPKAPDPMQTAQAQSGMNRDTAIAQQMLNMVNQVGPWGSTTYSPTGTTSYRDSSGKVVTIPTFTQTTQYTPEQQAIFDRSTQAQTNLADLAVDQSARMRDYLADPFEFNNQDAADWAYDLASSRILPQQQQATSDLRNQLINSGLRPGTAAFEREMTRLQQGQQDQLNQLALQGRSQAFNEALAQRSQPINEISALLSGSQIAAPNAGFSAVPQTGVGGVDYSGLVQQNYQQQLANRQAAMGGLFGLAGTLGGAAIMSDIRTKEDIERIGTLDNGLPVYAFNYKSGGPRQIGLMAQDVEKVNPDAVIEVDGIKYVNYGKAVQ